MMSFGEFVARRGRDVPTASTELTPQVAASLAVPNGEDTKKMMDRSRKHGLPISPQSLQAAISPETHKLASKAVQPLLPEH